MVIHSIKHEKNFFFESVSAGKKEGEKLYMLWVEFSHMQDLDSSLRGSNKLIVKVFNGSTLNLKKDYQIRLH